MIAKCPCERCGKNIEFATEEFLSGSSIVCPHCGKETFLSVKTRSVHRRLANRAQRLGVRQSSGAFGRRGNRWEADGRRICSNGARASARFSVRTGEGAGNSPRGRAGVS